MRKKYKYLVSVFSVGGDLHLGVKAEFYSLAFAKKYKSRISKTLDKHFYLCIEKQEIIPKVFNQSTIYDFGA